MDRDEVIKELTNLPTTIYNGFYQLRITHDLRNKVIAMLKKQEAVKPCVTVDTWICPKCGHTLESQHLIDDKENPQVLVHEQYNFCPNCGQAVKWE